MTDLLRIELIIVALVISCFIFIKIRKRKIETQYTIIWIFICFALIIGAIFPGLIEKVTDFMGLETPSNLVFLLGIFTLLIMNLKHTEKISQDEKKIRKLIQEVSILKKKVEDSFNEDGE